MAKNVEITEEATDLRIWIRHGSQSEIPTALFLMVWLVGWAFGEVFALLMLFAPGTEIMVRVFFVVWLTPWTIGGGFAAISMIRMLGGYEIVEIGRGLIKITRSFVFFKHRRQYDIFRITELHSHPKDPRKFAFINSGLFQFQYEGKSIRFGASLSPKDKDEIFRRIREHRDFKAGNFR